MGFETVVLNKVASVLSSTRFAEFQCGTLFVADITQEQAQSVLNELNVDCRCNILMNKCGTEYAYDFT